MISFRMGSSSPVIVPLICCRINVLSPSVFPQTVSIFSPVTRLFLELPNKFGYDPFWYTLVDSYSIQFRATACMDVYVALSQAVAVTTIETYEIVIGGESNTVSEIRRGQGGQVIDSYTGTVLREYTVAILVALYPC